MSRRPFDLAKLDFEGIRLRKRKKLLLFSSLPVGVVMLITIKMLSLPILSGVAHMNYGQSQNDSAISWLQPLTWANWMEPYKVYFNQGNAYFKSGKYDQSEGKFRQALESVPEAKECDVRINLALSIEQQADRLLSEKKYDAAILKYDDAKAVLYDGEDSCSVRFHNKMTESDNSNDSDDKENDNQQGSDNSGDNSRDVRNIEKRIKVKSSSAKQRRNDDKITQTDEKDSSTKDLKDTEQKMKKLEDNANKAQKKRVERNQQNRHNEDYEKNHGKSDYRKKSW